MDAFLDVIVATVQVKKTDCEKGSFIGMFKCISSADC